MSTIGEIIDHFSGTLIKLLPVSAVIILINVLTAPTDSLIFSIATPWVTTFFVLGMCTNIYSTCMLIQSLGSNCFFLQPSLALIVYRIWRSVCSLGPYQKHGGGFIPVVMALVESGALHASAWLALLITYLLDSNGQYTVVDTITPLIVCCSLWSTRTFCVTDVSPVSPKSGSRVYFNNYPNQRLCFWEDEWNRRYKSY